MMIIVSVEDRIRIEAQTELRLPLFLADERESTCAAVTMSNRPKRASSN